MQTAANQYDAWHDARHDAWHDARSAGEPDDGIIFLDDACVELIEEPPARRASVRWPSGTSLETAVTRVWIRPYAAR